MGGVQSTVLFDDRGNLRDLDDTENIDNQYLDQTLEDLFSDVAIKEGVTKSSAELSTIVWASPFKRSRRLRLNEQDLTLTSSADGRWANIQAGTQFQPGIHRFQINVLSCQNGGVGIGLISGKHPSETAPGMKSNYAGYSWLGTGYFYNRGSGDMRGHTIVTGDVITCVVDNKDDGDGTIEFFVGSESLGPWKVNIHGMTLRPVVCLYSTADTVQLIESGSAALVSSSGTGPVRVSTDLFSSSSNKEQLGTTINQVSASSRRAQRQLEIVPPELRSMHQEETENIYHSVLTNEVQLMELTSDLSSISKFTDDMYSRFVKLRRIQLALTRDDLRRKQSNKPVQINIQQDTATLMWKSFLDSTIQLILVVIDSAQQSRDPEIISPVLDRLTQMLDALPEQTHLGATHVPKPVDQSLQTLFDSLIKLAKTMLQTSVSSHTASDAVSKQASDDLLPILFRIAYARASLPNMLSIINFLIESDIESVHMADAVRWLAEEQLPSNIILGSIHNVVNLEQLVWDPIDPQDEDAAPFSAKITTDGQFLYILSVNGTLFKIGTGFNDTIAAKIYAVLPELNTSEDPCSLACVQSVIYFRSATTAPLPFFMIDPSSLTIMEEQQQDLLVLLDDSNENADPIVSTDDTSTSASTEPGSSPSSSSSSTAASAAIERTSSGISLGDANTLKQHVLFHPQPSDEQHKAFKRNDSQTISNKWGIIPNTSPIFSDNKYLYQLSQKTLQQGSDANQQAEMEGEGNVFVPGEYSVDVYDPQQNLSHLRSVTLRGFPDSSKGRVVLAVNCGDQNAVTVDGIEFGPDQFYDGMRHNSNPIIPHPSIH
eukprot:TRINITY_DN1490_c0_g1_i15.p1 TRINITY_DN1490_c0_g1~~TRINITY_DN1490_c0_g1_i15.p1  ORF type:complete len:827 (-),score=238.81 TRINITY_DN1490_c0_g1_i15:12-2492(-)